MDYLKSKVVRAGSPSSSEGDESDDEAASCDGGSEAEEEDSRAAPTQQDREGTGPSPERGTPSGNRKPQEARAEVCWDSEGFGFPDTPYSARCSSPGGLGTTPHTP